MDNQIIFGVTDEQSGYKDEILLTNITTVQNKFERLT